jgi:hypothetical protein
MCQFCYPHWKSFYEIFLKPTKIMFLSFSRIVVRSVVENEETLSTKTLDSVHSLNKLFLHEILFLPKPFLVLII